MCFEGFLVCGGGLFSYLKVGNEMLLCSCVVIMLSIKYDRLLGLSFDKEKRLL